MQLESANACWASWALVKEGANKRIRNKYVTQEKITVNTKSNFCTK